MKRKNRKHSKIDLLPGELKDTVEQMMQANFTYAEIAEFIKNQGFEISVSSVARHAATLDASVQTLRMAQENFKVIMGEISKYPQLDTTEGIIRLLSNNVLEAIMHTPEERWKDLDPIKLMRQANALVRAAAYKTSTDIKNKDVMEQGLEYVKVLAFESMAKERPELYEEVVKFIDTKMTKS